MKKIFVILIVTLLGYESIAQKGDSHYERKNGNHTDVYTTEELKVIFKKTGAYFDNLRIQLFKAIKIGYDKAGKVFPVKNTNDPANIDFVFDNTKYIQKVEYGDQIQNGYRIGNNPDHWVKTRKTDGYYGVFEYDGVSVRFIDPNCCNIQKEFGTYEPLLPVAFKPDATDTVRTAGVTVINNIYNNNSISGSANNTNTITNTVETPASGGTEYVLTDDRDNGFTREVGWGYQPPQIMPRQGARGFVRFDINGGRQQNYQPLPGPPQQPANHASGTSGFKEGNKPFKASGTRGRRN